MTKMTQAELKDFVFSVLNKEDYKEVVEKELFHSYTPTEDHDFLAELESKDVRIEYEDSYGGEDMGKDYWSVYSFTDGTNVVYVKFNGWYQSYNGSEFEEFFEVFPKEVTKIEFTRKK